jgi:hypothetical protein
MKKYFTSGIDSQQVDAKRIRDYTDNKGIRWECWIPIGNAFSSWVRLECNGKRTRFVYDPNGSFKRNHALYPESEEESLALNLPKFRLK